MKFSTLDSDKMNQEIVINKKLLAMSMRKFAKNQNTYNVVNTQSNDGSVSPRLLNSQKLKYINILFKIQKFNAHNRLNRSRRKSNELYMYDSLSLNE